MTVAVLIREQFGDECEIDVDIDPKKNEIFLLLGGTATFIGQWPDLDVVIMKAMNGKDLNKNTLPSPFDTEEVKGPILLIRMDDESNPQDFTLQEYITFARGNKRITV